MPMKMLQHLQPNQHQPRLVALTTMMKHQQQQVHRFKPSQTQKAEDILAMIRSRQKQ
jgi:hypothetical protein